MIRLRATPQSGFVDSPAGGVSAMLAFLVFGPMLDLKNTLMLATECRPRFIIRFIATVAAACFLAAIAAHLVMGA